MSNPAEIAFEQEIQAKGLTAPRLTPADIDAVIVDEAYHLFPGTTLTVCCLTLRNGFSVVGESATASAANFDESIGRRLARSDARDKIWRLEGYLLRERLHAAPIIGPSAERLKDALIRVVGISDEKELRTAKKELLLMCQANEDVAAALNAVEILLEGMATTPAGPAGA
jgi:hypothetical protein